VYGKLGIKCWVCSGDTKPEKREQKAEAVVA
jgi:ribosomal protein S3